ncbi:ABC-three component system protein [Candidatus Viridilinea mediisalina]|uniref:ABC-three component system protein n=1 Tax=Candidatus Viridilinea mediisalina TaxID=2024553 RepID=UPI000F590421|nr:ABC-three component system protein [Candidatus Viridilinea mediisalina]
MYDIQRYFYELKFLSEYLKKRSTEFQSFFEEIMEKAYPGDFQRVRPWGNIGDRKNDGYLKSRRCLYQVYAPNEMRIAKALEKIEEDFKGALLYWEAHFDIWVFVHNSYHGLAPDILNKLLILEEKYSPIKIEPCGFEELRREVFRMNIDTLSSLLGPAPSAKDMLSIGIEDLRPVIANIAGHKPDLVQKIQPVPPGKIEANGLSNSVEELLKFGMRKAPLVQRFFDRWHDPTFGASIAQSFQDEYNRLKEQRLTPDEIFCELQRFAGGDLVPDPATQSSVLAVIAYLFERCHIYEASRVLTEE